MQIGVRQQCEVASAFDRGIYLALVMRACTGQSRRHDLAVFLDEVLQRVDILVVHLLHLRYGEAAKLLALEQRVLLLTFFFELALVELFAKCHDVGSCIQ